MRLGAAAFLCAALAALCLVFGLRAPDDAAAAPPAPPAKRVVIFSARRVPELFGAAIARAELDRELRAALGSTPACVAADSTDGAPLARVHSDEPFVPASTIKLLTGVAALAHLGPDAHFTTRVVRGPTRGSVVVVGGGDPTLATDTFAAERRATERWRTAHFTPLTRLADAVSAAGIQSIAVLGVDDSGADTLRYLPDWKPNYGRDGEIGALGALAVDSGFANGIPAADPALLAGARLAEILRARGIAVARVARVRAPSGAPEVARLESPPLTTIVADMLTASDDFVAEEVARALGDGTTASGVQTIEAELRKLGVPMAGLAIHDGSGLAPDDEITCATLLAVVARLSDPRFAAADRGLPVAAQTGTLTSRFVGDRLARRLRAKTGTLDGVVGLAGIIDGHPGQRFAFLANGSFSRAFGQALQKAVVRPIAAAPAMRASASALAPRP